MHSRKVTGIAAMSALLLMQGSSVAQDRPVELTPAGKAILAEKLADTDRQLDVPWSAEPVWFVAPKLTFPLPMCAFPGGLCGAVHRDGTVAVPPRYDWVGKFSDGRASVRADGLYGFVDEGGHEVVKPQYAIVGEYKYGFAQVDIDGKSGLIDRDGKLIIPAKYGFVEAIGPDRVLVSEMRQLDGEPGAEGFSDYRAIIATPLPKSLRLEDLTTRIVDLRGIPVEQENRWFLGAPSFPFNGNSPLSWREKDELWGLARADGSWLVEPKFEQVEKLSDGLALVKLNGKFGFLNETGHLVIEPIFDQAWSFKPGLNRTAAARDGIYGLIDKTGAWVLQSKYLQVRPAVSHRVHEGDTEKSFGWHFKDGDHWGLLTHDWHVWLPADFDEPVYRCDDGRLAGYKNREVLLFLNDGTPLQPPNGRIVNENRGVLFLQGAGMPDGRIASQACLSTPPYVLWVGDKAGLIDAGGQPLTPVQFDAIARLAHGISNVKTDGKWGRIGPDGKWLLEPKFDRLSSGLELFVASIDGKRGFMRADGNWLIEPKFDAASIRRDGETAFVTISGATGLLRLTDQSWVIAPRPGVMCDIKYAVMAQVDGRRAILSQTGESWIDIGAERIGIDPEFGLQTYLKDGKWGLVDTAGQVTVEPSYDAPVSFKPGLRGIAWAKREDKWCAIDRRGHAVSRIPCMDNDPIPTNGYFKCTVE
jgi:WG repeat protein